MKNFLNRIDHLVLTVANVDTTVDFYTKALGMTAEIFGEGRKALTFGNQKFNLHQKGQEIDPKAGVPTCGSIDICFVSERPLEEVMMWLKECRVPIAEGPINRTGATGKIRSIYLRDPDQNLIEISTYR
jgi:catechol 2,3-dioxygenase-like lactoylglutathione lyase family enzyme